MADSDALRMRRYRAHQAGIHELCIPGRCKELGSSPGQVQAAQATAALAAAVAEEFPKSDPLSRALALRLVELSEGRGPAAVQALRALGGAGGRPAGRSVSRWPRRVPPAPVEPPAWVRHFDPAAWSGPTDWYAARRGWLAEYPQWDFVAERRERIARRRTARG